MYNQLWGRFPPALSYNMDQVHSPFVVNNDSTFTTHDDNEIHMSAPSDALRKRQFNMHVLVNAGAVNNHQGTFGIFKKGTGKIISKTEKNRWDARSKVFFQRKAFFDTPVMMNIVEIFVKHKVEVL